MSYFHFVFYYNTSCVHLRVSVAKRKWPVDMACFAVDIVFWRSRGSPLMVDVKGYIEDAFFRDLNVTHRDMEPKADNCTKVT